MIVSGWGRGIRTWAYPQRKSIHFQPSITASLLPLLSGGWTCASVSRPCWPKKWNSSWKEKACLADNKVPWQFCLLIYLFLNLDQCLPLPPSHYVCDACEKCKPGGPGTKTLLHHSWAFYDLYKKAASVGIALVQCTYKSSVWVLFFFISVTTQTNRPEIYRPESWFHLQADSSEKKNLSSLASLCSLRQMGVVLSFTNAAVSLRLGDSVDPQLGPGVINCSHVVSFFFIKKESVTNPKPLMECSSDLCLGKVCCTKSFLLFFFPPERECFRRPNGRGLMVHIYGKGEETITGTLLTDFLCVLPLHVWQPWVTRAFAALAIFPGVIAWCYSIQRPCQTPCF